MTKEPLAGYHNVACIIQSGKKYFYALYDSEIGKGDYVLVTGAAAGEVWEIDSVFGSRAADLIDAKITEEVICKLDRKQHIEYQERVNMRIHARELRKQLDGLRRAMLENISEEYLESLSGEYKSLKKELKETREAIGLNGNYVPGRDN